MLSRLIALAVLTCLAWSTSASVLDAVVPEDMLENSPSATPSRLPPLALIATDAITTELATMKKHAPSDAGVAQIEGMIQMMNKESDPASSHRCDAKIPADQATCSAQTTKSGCESVVDTDSGQMCTYQMDGGTKDMEDLLTSAKTTINAAVTTMLSGLETAYANAKLDLQAMDTAIDNSKQTISPTELEAIKTKATTWCSKKRALETATSDASTAASALTTKLNEPLGLSDVLVKEVGTIGPSDCSQANSDAKDSTCSAGSPNLASRIQTKIDTVRGEYLAASWDKFEKDALETTATTEEGASKDAFQDTVTVTASTYHSMCGSSDQVHNTAVTLFNGNNAGRSAMYRSLGVILCHINHMSSGQTFTVPTNLLKSGEANPTTSATDCNGKLKADSTIKTELFPDATSNEDSNKACPALSAYEDDIRNYGSLGFDKDEADWSATTTKCDAVTAHAATGGPGLAPYQSLGLIAGTGHDIKTAAKPFSINPATALNNNPFNEESLLSMTDINGHYYTPVWVDLNGDGHSDLVMGQNTASVDTLDVYLNDGAKGFTKDNTLLTNVESSQGGTYTPAFPDLDGDGDVDLILAVNDDLRHYENTGSATAPAWTLRLWRTNSQVKADSSPSSPLKDTYVNERMRPTFIDLDDDGDLDYVCMWNYGFKYYLNTGTAQAAVFVEQTKSTSPFADLSLGGSDRGFASAFNDFDNDGDWDMVVRKSGYSYYWENTGTAQAASFPSSSGAVRLNQIPYDRYSGALAFFPKDMTVNDLPL